MNVDLLIETFNANIAYIEKHHTSLFSKLAGLDSAVANGYYQEKYELVNDKNYFDVLEKATGNHLYSSDSQEYAKIAAKSVNYKIDANVFICSPEYSAQYLSDMTDMLENMADKKINYKELSKIKKFVFFGVGLGLHLKSIDAKINASSYLIVEDDLELFRLSLFLTNYSDLAKNAKITFSIFDDAEEFTLVCENYLQDSFQDNQYIKFFEMLSHSEKKVQEFHLSVTNQAHLRFNFLSLLTQSLLPLEYLDKPYQFLHKDVSFKGSLLEEKPFLLLGAGPSLEKNVALLKKKADDFIIVAVSAVLIFLEKENIVPNIVIHLDAFENARSHFDGLSSLDFLRDTQFLFSAKTDALITLRLNQKNIFFFENSTEYKTDSFRPSSPCVGSISYQILLYMGVKNLYLLGLDLAIDSQTGKTHLESHRYVETLDIKNALKHNDMIEYKKNLIEVAGNGVDIVYTTPHFQTSIAAINYATKVLKKEFQSIQNFGNGAKYNEVETVVFEDISLQRISCNIAEELQKIFGYKSSHGLTFKEKKVIEDKLLYAKQIRKILQKYLEQNVDNTKDFKANILSLIDDIVKEDLNDLAKMIDLYFRYIVPYIFDYLNRQNLNVSKQELQSIKEKLVPYLYSLI